MTQTTSKKSQAERATNISKARECYDNRKVNRPKQAWNEEKRQWFKV